MIPIEHNIPNIYIKISVSIKEKKKNKLVFSDYIQNKFSLIFQSEDFYKSFGSKSQILCYGRRSFYESPEGIIILKPTEEFFSQFRGVPKTQIKRFRSGHKFILDTKLCAKFSESIHSAIDDKIYGIQMTEAIPSSGTKIIDKNLYSAFLFPYDQSVLFKATKEERDKIVAKEISDSYEASYIKTNLRKKEYNG